MPSRPASLALVALVVLAGCSGVSGPGTTDPGATSAAGTPTPTPTVTTTEPTTTAIPAASVVDYRDLPNGTQRLVRIALENGSVRRDADEFDGFSQADHEADEYLRYDGTTYAIEWKNHMRAEYYLWSVESTNDTESEQNTTVVAYETLSARGQRLFDQVRMGANHSDMYGLEAFPEELRLHRYVAFEGQLYEIVALHSDIPVWELRLEPVDRGRTEG